MASRFKVWRATRKIKEDIGEFYKPCKEAKKSEHKTDIDMCKDGIRQIENYYKDDTFSDVVLLKRLKGLLKGRVFSKEYIVPFGVGTCGSLIVWLATYLSVDNGMLAQIGEAPKMLKLLVTSVVWSNFILWLLLVIIVLVIFFYGIMQTDFETKNLIFVPAEISIIKQKLIDDYDFNFDYVAKPKTSQKLAESAIDSNTFLTIENGGKKLKYKLVEVTEKNI